MISAMAYYFFIKQDNARRLIALTLTLSRGERGLFVPILAYLMAVGVCLG